MGSSCRTFCEQTLGAPVRLPKRTPHIVPLTEGSQTPPALRTSQARAGFPFWRMIRRSARLESDHARRGVARIVLSYGHYVA